MRKQPNTIFHAFNWLLKDIGSDSYKDFLQKLKNDGFDAVQISPVQKCINNSRTWYYRYQPYDYLKIEGLGNKSDLEQLCKAAKEEGISIIADVVFNHVAVLVDNDEWREANIKKENGYPEDIFSLYKRVSDEIPNFSISDIREWRSMDENYEWDEAPYRIIGFGNDEWIDLRPTKNVIDIQKQHLDILLGCGVTGFRFDAVKHMDPWQFKTYVNYIYSKNPNAWVYGEVLSQDKSLHKEYQHIAPSTDFDLAAQLKSAFSFGGSLNSLAMPEILGHFTTRFARNHDTIFNSGFENFKYSTFHDAQLAWSYLLSISYGSVLVFDDDYENDNQDIDLVKYGSRFRKRMTEKKVNSHFIHDINLIIGTYNNDLMIIGREKHGFVIINKSNNFIDVPVADFTNTMLEGNYTDLQYKTNIKIETSGNGRKYVTKWGKPDRGGLQIGGRTALYFVSKDY